MNYIFWELSSSSPRRATERWFGLVERAGRYLLLGMVRTDFSVSLRIWEAPIATSAAIQKTTALQHATTSTTAHYTTLHPAVVGEVTTATIATTPKKTQVQPPFGPSVD